jgi:hypothetical protein
MLAAGNAIRDVEQSVAFADKTLEVIKEFVYLFGIPGDTE